MKTSLLGHVAKPAESPYWRALALVAVSLLAATAVALLPWASGHAPLGSAMGRRAFPLQQPQPQAQPQRQQQQQQDSCDLGDVISDSPFARACTLLEDACVDQGRIILHGEQYRPQTNGVPHDGPPVGVPHFKPDDRQRAYHLIYPGGATKDIRAGMPSIHCRPVTAREPRQYLQHPAFSNCTVPVVFYPHNPFNFAHSLRDTGAVMYSALRATAWAEHARLVPMTGEGLAISRLNRALWQPLSRLRVESWADFSTRLKDGEEGGPPPADSSPPPSYEGGERRCFKRMFVCTEDVRYALAVPKDGSTPRPLVFRWYEYAQHIVRQVTRRSQEQQEQQQQGSGAAVGPLTAAQEDEERQRRERDVSVLRRLGSDSADSPVTLRVVFQKRGNADKRERQLDNAADLIERCNAWRYTAPSGARVRGSCTEAEFPSLAAGVAVAQEADVMVGAHGANLGNAWFMRPGTSVVELTMFGFDDRIAHGNNARFNVMDPESQVAVWKLLLCDPEGSWTPSEREAAEIAEGRTSRTDWPKYRNLVVRWEALETALRAAVDTAGNMTTYRQRYEDGDWWWLSTATDTLPAGPNDTQTCKRAREQGIID